MNHPGEKNLNTYRILFLIKGIFDLLIIIIGAIYALLGSVMSEQMQRDAMRTGQELPFDPSTFFTIIGIVLVLIAIITGVPALMASARFKQKRGRTFIIVAAGINCLTGILGIILCIFTVMELSKPAVKEVFAENDGV
ncbi:MAG: hypothetical protein Crog4KO_03010 [Crocinitomicaceae bacterium]